MRLPECDVPDIPAFYGGKSVFITGGTGFMGKVLVERLLTECPQVRNIFLLIREKKNLTSDQRLQLLKQNQVFDVLRARDPGQLDKLVAVAGDITRRQFGITPAAWSQLAEVSIVFHTAATVKIQEELKLSIDQNLRSTMTILKLCDSLPKVDVFVHVSTAYSNAELQAIQEKVYPPPADLSTLLELVDEEGECQEELRKLTETKPNSYTFTKAMAEHVVDRHECAYPVAIFKPSIVISSLRHPFPGWIENWNGPSGVIASTSAGVLRVFRSRAAARADMVPVDIAVDTLIAVAWETALDKPPAARVYHCSCMENPTTWGEVTDAINSSSPLYPSRHALMYPHLTIISNRYAYLIMETVLQTIPFYTIEYIKRIFGVKMGHNLIQVNSNLRAMNKALEFFAVREWDFELKNTTRLRDRLSEKDKTRFNLDPKTINWPQIMKDFIRGSRRHVLKERDDDLEAVRARIRLLSLLHTATKVLLTLTSLRIVNHWLSVRDIFQQIYRILVVKFNEIVYLPKFLTIAQF